MTIFYYLLEHFISLQKSIGESLYSSFFQCWENEDIIIFVRDLYVYNLYGDPSLSFASYPSVIAPERPEKPTGPPSISPGATNSYSTFVDEAPYDMVYYTWDWGDGQMTEPIGPYIPGGSVTVSHLWEVPGDYRVRVKAIGLTGEDSEWSEPLVVHVSGPVLKVTQISGGLFTLNAVVKNIGDSIGSDIIWSIELFGGSILLGKHTTGVIDTLDVGQERIIVSNLIAGIARPSVVTIEASVPNGSSDIEVQSAEIVGFLIRIS